MTGDSFTPPITGQAAIVHLSRTGPNPTLDLLAEALDTAPAQRVKDFARSAQARRQLGPACRHLAAHPDVVALQQRRFNALTQAQIRTLAATLLNITASSPDGQRLTPS